MQETFNPILSQEDVRGWSLTKQIPVPAPNTVLVLSRSGGDLLVIGHTDKPISFSRFKFGGYNFLYNVDIGEYVLKIDCSLPSKTSGFDFQTVVEVTCSVSNPEIIVKCGTQDIASVLKSRLINEMKQISRDYDLREDAVAEKDINRSVRRRVVDEGCFDDLGLRVPQLVASLQIDSSAIESIRKVTRIQLNEAALLAEKEAQLRLAQVDEIAQIKLDELKRMRASASHAHYEKILQGGETSLLAAYLTQNPGDIAGLIERFDKQKQFASSSNMELLKVMIEEDAIEASQLGETGGRVLRRLMGIPESKPSSLESNETDQDPVLPLADDIDLLGDVPG
jgi:hypothetical protein